MKAFADVIYYGCSGPISSEQIEFAILLGKRLGRQEKLFKDVWGDTRLDVIKEDD